MILMHYVCKLLSSEVEVNQIPYLSKKYSIYKKKFCTQVLNIYTYSYLNL